MRHQSRELALQILFQHEFSAGVSASELARVLGGDIDKETVDYAKALVDGVVNHKTDIDAKISSASHRWKIDRMASVDRNVLRIAVYEMKFAPHVLEKNIVIDEAVEIAKKFGTTESGAFVNGVLDQISKG